MQVYAPMDDDLFAKARDSSTVVERSTRAAPARAAPATGGKPSEQLLSATQMNDAARVQALIDGGITVSFANSVGQTALHIAALWGNAEACKTLLANGAALNPQNTLSGATPLHMAAASSKDLSGRMACAKLIIDAGADLKIKDFEGLMPWQHADLSDGVFELVQLLRPPM